MGSHKLGSLCRLDLSPISKSYHFPEFLFPIARRKLVGRLSSTFCKVVLARVPGPVLSSPDCLQGCVFTRDINAAMRISDAMETGTVQVSCLLPCLLVMWGAVLELGWQTERSEQQTMPKKITISGQCL